MIKFENIETFGWEAATRGMRNPMNSWDKSDSGLVKNRLKLNGGTEYPWHFEIGKTDLKLMQSLVKAGTDHSKFMRMINVTIDVTAPLYWWKEYDTYKVGTVANSCSTMHKIHAKEFTLDDFSHEHMLDVERETIIFNNAPGDYWNSIALLDITVRILNVYRQRYLETKDKRYWWQMIQLLPSSYNQKRTVQLNCQVLRHMYFSRKNHRLDEWIHFRNMIKSLPYAEELICLKEKE